MTLKRNPNKKFFTATCLAAGAFVAGVSGLPTGASAFETELYGQVNKGFMVFDDGDTTRANIVDNNVSSTRFGLRAEKQIDFDLTASFLMEMQANSNSSAGLSQASSRSDSDPANLSTRHMRAGLGGAWGTLLIGKTASATDGITEIDLGAVQDVFTSSAGRLAGGLDFRRKDGTLTGVNLSQVADGFDGLAFSGGSADDGTDGFGSGFGDRFNLVRYNSPLFKGTNISVAYTQDQHVDVALRYKRRIEGAGLDLSLGAGYVNYETGEGVTGNEIRHQLSGSFSLLHDSGFALTTAYGRRDYKQMDAGNEEPWFIYNKLSYQHKKWGFAVDYAHHDNIDITSTNNTDVGVFGVGVQRDLGYGVSAAAYGRFHDLDREGENTETLQVYGVNLRARF